MKEDIVKLRVGIDGLSQLVNNLKPIKALESREVFYNGFNSTEINKAYDSLILAKAWLGKLLGELGEPSPYTKDGKRKTVEDIEPTADSSKVVEGLRQPFTGKDNTHNIVSSKDTWELNGKEMNFYSDFNHIQKVDWLRQEIEKVAEKVEGFPQITAEQFENHFIPFSSKGTKLCQANAYNHLCEARFWLGFELQRIKEERK